MKKKTMLLSILALCLVMYIGVGEAMAYFTTYAYAKGGYPVHLGNREEIDEEFSAWTKHIKLTSKEDSEPVYIRARAYAGGSYSLTYSASEGGWSEGEDGWWYYSDIVPGGGETRELTVKIGNIPEDAKEGQTFHVAVVYESAAVQYQEDGTPYCDWSTPLDVVRTE